MIDQSTTQTIGMNIRTLVTRICSSIYSATNSQRNNQTYDEQLVIQILNISNRLGVTSYVKNWYEKSDQYGRSLENSLKNCFPEGDAVNLLSAGDSYWSSFGLSSGGEQPTVDNLNKHQYSYMLAEMASIANGTAPDTQKIHACIYEAAARCLYDQFNTAYNTFFSTSPGIDSYSSVANSAKQAITCEQTAVTYTPTSNSTAGDEGSSGGSAVTTLTDGSNRKTVSRDTYTRVSETFSNHIINTSTLHTRVMMSDLSENMIDSYDHARISNNFDKIQTSSEYFDKITELFEASVAIGLDDNISSTDNIKLQNQFLYDQIGDRSLVENDNSVASTRTQSTTS